MPHHISRLGPVPPSGVVVVQERLIVEGARRLPVPCPAGLEVVVFSDPVQKQIIRRDVDEAAELEVDGPPVADASAGLHVDKAGAAFPIDRRAAEDLGA